MKEKCCRNCLFFIDKTQPDKFGKWTFEFACHLHGSEARITDPEFQFCGDEHWISVKVKSRNEQLEKLGI